MLTTLSLVATFSLTIGAIGIESVATAWTASVLLTCVLPNAFSTAAEETLTLIKDFLVDVENLRKVIENA